MKVKLFHGSPKKLGVIKPKLAKGVRDFETQKAVFLCKTFRHAALYAVGKTLKGKTTFAVTPKNLIIVGKFKPAAGYVHEVEVDKSAVKEGERDQLISKRQLKPLKIYKVGPEAYQKNIIHVKNIAELEKGLK